MRSYALVEMVKGRLREFRREPSAFFFVLFMPILWMVLFGFGLSGDPRDRYGVGWIATADAGPAAPRIRDELAAAPQLSLRDGDAAELTRLLRRGDVLVLVALHDGRAHYVFDPQNRESRRARDVLDAAVQRAAGRTDPLATDDERVSIAGTRYVDFLVPGLLAMSILSTSLWGTGMTLVSNRRENLMKRLLATPVRPYQYILSHIIGRLVILLVEIATILTAARLIFGFHVEGGVLPLVAFATLGAAAVTALGVLLGSRATNTGAMNGIVNLIALPMMVFAGVWFSRANLPAWLADATRWLPLTPLVEGLRRIALEGAHLSSLGFEAGVLAVYFAVCSVLAGVFFKWY